MIILQTVWRPECRRQLKGTTTDHVLRTKEIDIVQPINCQIWEGFGRGGNYWPLSIYFGWVCSIDLLLRAFHGEEIFMMLFEQRSKVVCEGFWDAPLYLGLKCRDSSDRWGSREGKGGILGYKLLIHLVTVYKRLNQLHQSNDPNQLMLSP